MFRAEGVAGPEWAAWYRMTPLQRWRASERLWTTFLALGGPLIPNPIRKVLSSMHEHRVRALLMGGQACVFYGGAEFSRDTDIAILADAANLARLSGSTGRAQK